ncbi:MAG: thiamine-phosphate kinase [Candidatus Dormiibacterota bacterium]
MAVASPAELRRTGWDGDDPVSGVGEGPLLNVLMRLAGREDSSADIGLGDDAASWRPAAGAIVVWSTDSVAEDIDFRRRYQSPYQVGWKAWMAAVSDLAAMGAVCRGGLVAASIPRETSAAAVAAIQLGLVEAAAIDGASVMGGDVGATTGTLTLTVTVMGEIADGEPVRLGGGSAGQSLLVTGRLGEAAAALQMMESDAAEFPPQWSEHLLQPPSRIEAGLALRRAGATAMTDVSDGLLMDLERICSESAVGADLWLDHLPGPEGAAALSRRDELALNGGEDYELLAALPAGSVDDLLGEWKKRAVPISLIGVLTDRVGIQILRSPGGELFAPPASDGFRHF